MSSVAARNRDALNDPWRRLPERPIRRVVSVMAHDIVTSWTTRAEF
jgi:hypothetical protein